MTHKRKMSTEEKKVRAAYRRATRNADLNDYEGFEKRYNEYDRMSTAFLRTGEGIAAKEMEAEELIQARNYVRARTIMKNNLILKDAYLARAWAAAHNAHAAHESRETQVALIEAHRRYQSSKHHGA